MPSGEKATCVTRERRRVSVHLARFNQLIMAWHLHLTLAVTRATVGEGEEAVIMDGMCVQ